MNIFRFSLKTTSAPSSGGNDHRARAGRGGFERFLILLTVTAGAVMLLWAVLHKRKVEAFSAAPAGIEAAAASVPADFSPVFKPSRQHFLASFKEYFQLQSTPVQPIAFNHQRHLENGMQCTTCHPGVTEGPDAGIANVTFCMACHEEVANNNPEIKKLAAYADKGQDVPWQPVYWFYPSEHVRFWHAPHIRAGVDCQQCHGDLTKQKVAVRSRNLNMNFCISCHRAKGVSADCTTCHY